MFVLTLVMLWSQQHYSCFPLCSFLVCFFYFLTIFELIISSCLFFPLFVALFVCLLTILLHLVDLCLVNLFICSFSSVCQFFCGRGRHLLLIPSWSELSAAAARLMNLLNCSREITAYHLSLLNLVFFFHMKKPSRWGHKAQAAVCGWKVCLLCFGLRTHLFVPSPTVGVNPVPLGVLWRIKTRLMCSSWKPSFDSWMWGCCSLSGMPGMSLLILPLCFLFLTSWLHFGLWRHKLVFL